MTSAHQNTARSDLEQCLLGLNDMKRIFNSASFNSLFSLTDEIKRLKQENEMLQAQANSKANEATGLIQHAKNQADLAKAERDEVEKKLDRVEKEKKETEKKLKEVEAELKQRIETAAGLEDNYKKQLQKLKDELKDRDEDLDELRGYSVELKDVSDHQEAL